MLQFYDKFNIRHNIAELLEYLWQVPSHRDIWRKVEQLCISPLFSGLNTPLSLSLSHTHTHTFRHKFDCFMLFQIAKEEEKGVYLNFLNFLINDSIYLLDESLSKILELKGLEAEMSNTTEWERRPAQERQERTRLFQSQENVSLCAHAYVYVFVHTSIMNSKYA